MIKNWFSDTKRASKNVKQGVNQKKHTRLCVWWERKWSFKVTERVLRHQDLLLEKVEIEEQNTLSGLECAFWGQHLALGDLLCVSKSHLYDLRLWGLRSLSDVPKAAESAVCAAPGKQPTTLGSVTVAACKHGSYTRPLPWLCSGDSHSPSQGGLHFRCLHLLHLWLHLSMWRGWIAAQVGNGLVFQDWSCCCLLQTPFQCTDQITLLSTKARQNLTVNSLRKWTP